MKKILLYFLFLPILFTSCRWIVSTDEDKYEDSLVIVIVDTDSVQFVATPFLNQDIYFYEDTIKIAGKIELLKGSFVLDTAYALSLSEPIEVLPKKEVRDLEDPNIPQSNIKQMHLLWPDSDSVMERFLNKRVVVKGMLWGRYSGSHYTPVVMEVISMQLDN